MHVSKRCGHLEGQTTHDSQQCMSKLSPLKPCTRPECRLLVHTAIVLSMVAGPHSKVHSHGMSGLHAEHHPGYGLRSCPVPQPSKEAPSEQPGLTGPVLQCRPASANRVPEASPLLAGLELGLYNFAAGGLQAVGLQYTTATRGSLLILVGPLHCDCCKLKLALGLHKRLEVHLVWPQW